MKIIIVFLFFAALPFCLFAQQKLITKNATVSFYSFTPVENIEAKNNKLISVWDTATSHIEFSVLIKGFEFEKALMQEHFNEDYLESDKYPKAIFKGSIVGAHKIYLTVAGSYTTAVTGALTLHGITKQITAPAIIIVKNKAISATATFNILLADYAIKVPSLVADNISKNILIKIVVPSYQPFATK